MKVISIVNQKGGSGKTTTTVNLAASLAEKNKKILLIDLDPQSSASLWCGHRDKENLLFDIFINPEKSLDNVIKSTNNNNMDILPASPILSSVEKKLSNNLNTEIILKNRLSKLKKSYDFILIDCPPNLGILSLNALTASDYVLIPVESHVMALHGLVQLLRTITVVKKKTNPLLTIIGILPCRVNIRTKHAKEVIDQLQKRFSNQMFKVSIRENVKLAEAPLYRLSILKYASLSDAANDYRCLASELLEKVK